MPPVDVTDARNGPNLGNARDFSLTVVARCGLLAFDRAVSGSGMPGVPVVRRPIDVTLTRIVHMSSPTRQRLKTSPEVSGHIDLQAEIEGPSALAHASGFQNGASFLTDSRTTTSLPAALRPKLRGPLRSNPHLECNRRIMTNLKITRCLLGLAFGCVNLLAVVPLSADEPKLRTTLAGNAQLSMAFSPNGETLASGDRKATVQVWDVRTGKKRTALLGHTSPVWSVAFSPDGKMLASGSGQTLNLATPDGAEVGSGTGDPEIKLWDLATGKMSATLLGHTELVATIAFSPDGRSLASGSHDKSVRLWDMPAGKQRSVLKGHSAPVTAVAYSPDGRMLASASSDETIRLWDLQTGKGLFTLRGHTTFIGAVWSVAFTQDGKTLASGSQDTTIKLWDVATGKEKATLQGHVNPVYAIAFSPDGKMLASGSHDKTVKLWEVATEREEATLLGHTDAVMCVTFSPDGKTLATLSNGQIRLWDIDR
jgi:uncharacterized protein with WD repeat